MQLKSLQVKKPLWIIPLAVVLIALIGTVLFIKLAPQLLPKLTKRTELITFGDIKVKGSYYRGSSLLYLDIPNKTYSTMQVKLSQYKKGWVNDGIIFSFENSNPVKVPVSPSTNDRKLVGWILHPNFTFNGLVEVTFDNKKKVKFGLTCYYQEPDHEEVSDGGSTNYRCSPAKYSFVDFLFDQSKTYTFDISQTSDSQRFLWSYFPRVEVKLTDLPNFRDVRRVFDYNGNKIIMGVQKLAEYDPKSDTFIRISRPGSPEFYSAAKIGNVLYVSDNGDYFKQTQPKIYAVDLGSGEVTKTIEGLKDIPFDLINNSLYAFENDLWISTRDIIIKYSTTQNKILSTYTTAQLGYIGNENCGSSLELVDAPGTIKVVEFVCKNFISTYNYTTDSWEHKQASEIQARDYINKNPMDFGLTTLPAFLAVSTTPLNGKTYALSTKGIYEITGTKLPHIYYKKELSKLKDFVFVETPDGVNFIVVSIADAGHYQQLIGNKKLTDFLTLTVVNTQTGQETDLLTNSKYANETMANYYNSDTSFLNNQLFESKLEGGIFSLGQNFNSPVLTFNLLTKEIVLQN